MTAALSEKARNAMLSQVPLGRPGYPEDIAAAHWGVQDIPKILPQQLPFWLLTAHLTSQAR